MTNNPSTRLRDLKEDRFFEESVRLASQGIGTVLWLVPTIRCICSTLTKILQASTQRKSCAILQPKIFTLDGFASEMIRISEPTYRPLSEQQQRLLLLDIVHDLHQRKELNYFASIIETSGFAEAVLGTIEELKYRAIEPDELRKRSQTISNETDRKKLIQICRILEEYQKRLSTLHRLDVCDRLRLAARLLEEGRINPFKGIKNLFLIRKASLSIPEQLLIAALHNRFPDVYLHEPNDPPSNLPQGLNHLRQHLFQDRNSIVASQNVDGIQLIEAPGEYGESRLIARQIVQLLQSGIQPDDILVTARDLSHAFPLLEEVFGEYRIPIDLEGAKALYRNPAVGVLLRAIRLPEDHWPFPAVTALLRSSYFQPSWPECREDPEIPRHSESLLRQLGESRGRDSYLHAVGVWADSPPEGLEDEQAEEGRRIRRTKLARHCRPFLKRFFQTWDKFPIQGSARDFTHWIRRFAEEIGLTHLAQQCNEDQTALNCLWQELDHWSNQYRSSTKFSRSRFLQVLKALTSSHILPRSLRSNGRVRVLSAETADPLETDYLFIVRLGERTFPNLSPPKSLIDDGDRCALFEAGLLFPPISDRLKEERELFHRLISKPKKQLILSYPAVDEKGQPMLPSSFLIAVKECFVQDAIPTQRQRMLIEGYSTQTPLCEAESRVQLAVWMRELPSDDSRWQRTGMNPDLIANLQNAQRIANERFRIRKFTSHDGWLEHPAVLHEIRQRFGPEKVFSPTALEAYVSCPFRFFMEHILRLEPLEEPTDQVEHTRRGAAFHRALSRMHRLLQEIDPELLKQTSIPEEVNTRLFEQLDKAIEEYVERASSPASKMLWQLEGKRLKRFASKYRDHWDEFVTPWRKQKVLPTPAHLEADFGLGNQSGTPPLVITVGDVEVRIGGRIDRVDIAEMENELGFWIIDYKTGRSAYYTSNSLKRFEKLQLSLYAIAVERVLFPGKNARPLGLAYWMVTDDGVKTVLPGNKKQALNWLASPENWHQFRSQLEKWVAEIVHRIRKGRFPLAPRSEDCTETCHFGQVCRISQSRSVGKVWDLTLPAEEGTEAEASATL